MDIKKLQAIVIDALEDVKAQEIRAFDTVHLTSMFDRLVIASGTSNRQTKALAASVRDKVKEHGGNIVSIEGEETGEWVLVDLGDMVVHIMQPAIREYYRLEEIWGDKEIRLGAAKRTSKRTAEEVEEAPKKRSRHIAASQTTLDDEPKKPARKTAAKKTATKTATTKTTATKTAAKTASKTARTPAGKTVKVAATKTAAPRKTATKRATTRKAAE
ncbi:MAG TPA: ribosome silencing factor [Noviherbaspirillum sp.]|uniref:ribosome silencing factor n=1 Tax=Noviherbaspirillum sp. TaxID=1926288 RepID=UPI002B49B759|nr:ribosome silencing factor [Noviherbaspirillum sp.]HJV84354.1 ribosome silencing factor [Noviherbaspirillum sp.]